ncbi:MAG: serine hydrolase [Chloroflexota bacterium]|nr:serine hydrolase [Chloroflexota bacterium]
MLVAAFLVVLVLAGGSDSAVALPTSQTVAPPGEPSPGADVSAFAAPAPPALSARAAYALDATVGTELYAVNADERRAPASLTKVATALVVLEHGDLDETVTIEEGDLGDNSESQVGLEAGDSLTVRDLLFGLLIPSGNDAARALARHIGADLPDGDRDPSAAFVAEMNDVVAAHGLANTRFANPTGLDQEGHYASARDLAQLAASAMEDSLFAEIVALPDATLASRTRPDGYYVTTTNQLLVEGTVEGIKTGTTDKAGGCLISTVTVDENRVITVVLGSPVETTAEGRSESPARYDDTRVILGALPEDYRWLDPAEAPEIDGLSEELAVWEAALPDGPDIVLPIERAEELRYRLVLGPSGEPDAEIGRVLFFLGGDFLTERAVVQAA